ncbi:hypothetical protein DPSP01_000127 [Paraphaeosphaeria sporulosa]
MRQPSFTMSAARIDASTNKHARLAYQVNTFRCQKFECFDEAHEATRMLANQRRRYAAPARRITKKLLRPPITSPKPLPHNPKPSITSHASSLTHMYALNICTNAKVEEIPNAP